MPTETIIAVSVILTIFIGFAVILAWTDFQTGKALRDRSAK